MKLEMPVQEAKRAVIPLRVLAHQFARMRKLHFEFLKRVYSEQNVPEFAGFNTKLCREDGQCIQPATRAIYTPLIDMDPADSDTMLTAVEDRGTTFVTRVRTKHYDRHNDQLLYRAADNVGLSRAILTIRTKVWRHAYADEFHWLCRKQ